MNKIYKVIWSKTQHCFVVVSELCRSKAKILSVSEAHIISSSPKKHFSFSKAFKVTPIVAGLLLAGFSTFAYAASPAISTNSQTNTTISPQTKSVLVQAARQNSALVDTAPLSIPNEATVSSNNRGDVNIGGNANVSTNRISPPGSAVIISNGNTIRLTGGVGDGGLFRIIGGGSNTIISAGSRINTNGGLFNIIGNSNTVTLTGGIGVTAISGGSFNITGNNNRIAASGSYIATVGGGSISITGTSNIITASGNFATAISGGSVTISGISNIINGSVVSSGSISIIGVSNDIRGSVDGSGSVTISGSSNIITGNNVTAISGDSVTILGSSNIITESTGNGTTAISGNTINISSSSNIITASAENNAIAINGGTITISGDSNTVTGSAGNNATAISGGSVTIAGTSNTVTASGNNGSVINGNTITISGTSNTITALGNIGIAISGNTVTISGSSNIINGSVTGDDITITGIAGGTSGAQIFGSVDSNSALILNNAWVTGTVSGSTEQVNGGFLTASTNTLNSNVTLGKGEHFGFIQVSSTQTTITPETLTVNGNLTGNGGDVWLNTDLGTNANSKVDQLTINGEVAGETIPIDITNTSQEGGKTTASGIEIISANRVAATDTTPFRLDTPNGILSVGAYDYHLVSRVNSSGSTIWSLTSTILPPVIALPTVDSTISDATSGTTTSGTTNSGTTSGTATSSTTTSSAPPASNLVVTYSPLAYLVSIPNFVLQNATTENIDAINGVMQQTTDSRLQGQSPGHDIWFKLIQAYNNNDTRGTVSTNYKNNLYGFLLGGDVLHLKQDNLGVYTGYQNGSVDAIATTYSDASGTLLTIPNSNVGNLTLNDYTLGLYNQYHDHSFIVNTFLQGSLGDMETSNIPAISNDAHFNINSLATQATVGYTVTLSKSLELIPFGGVQATWDHLDNASFKDSIGDITIVDFKHDNTASVLAGVNGYLTLVKNKNATPIVHLTFGTYIQQYLGNSNTNNVEIPTNGFTSNLNSSISKTFMNVNVGCSCQATKNLYLGLGVALGYNLGSVHAINFSSTERFHLKYQF